MGTGYPSALDNFGLPNAADPLGSSTPTLLQAYTNLRDAVQAAQAELGLNPSGSSATVLARLDAMVASGGIPGTVFDAKGDLLVGTGPDTYTKVSLGAAGDVWTSDPTLSAGAKWAPAVTGTTGTGIPSGWTAPTAGFNGGVVDAAPELQGILTTNKRLYLPPGTYRCTSRLMVDSGCMIWVAKGAILQKDFTNTGGTTGSFISNRSWTGGAGRNGAVEVDDVWVMGEGTVEAKAQVRRGNVSGGAMTNGSPTLTLAGAAFTVDDIGTGVLVRGAVSGNSDLQATIIARTNGTTVTLSVNATRTITAETVDTIAYGNIVGLLGNRICLRDFTTTYWSGGRHTVLGGDFIRMYNTKFYGGGGQINNGGVRFCGGKQFIGMGLHCESGDDTFQFVPVEPSPDPLADISIEDCTYIGCTGSSTDAKFMVLGLQDGGAAGAADGLVTMTCSIRNSGFIGCRGSSTSLAFLMQNISSSGAIVNPFITDCAVNMQGATTVGGPTSNINAFASTGGCRGANITRLEIRNATRAVFSMQRGGENTVIDGLKATRATGNSLYMLRISGKNTKVRNCVLDNNSSNVEAILVTPPVLELVTGAGQATGVRAANGTMTVGSPILTSATANFVTGDVGTDLTVEGAGASGTQLLICTVVSRQSATQVTLSKNAVNAVTGTGIIYSYTVAGPNPSDVTIEKNRIVKIAATTGTGYGIEAANVDGLTIDGNIFEQTAGATNARAFNILAPCTNVQIGEKNNWRGLTAATKYLIATGAGVTWLGNGVSTATTAQLASVTAVVNTSAKVTGRQVFNTTTSRPVWASGTATTSTWRFHDGTTAHTPV